MSDASHIPVFTILATDPVHRRTIECFHWTRSAEDGIARAKVEAAYHGYTHLTNFRAVPFEMPRRFNHDSN